MRKTLILLALAVVTVASVGCVGRCRNLFRRGSPCLGTATVAPAMIGAPRAIAVPRAQPVVTPQMIQQPACCPQQVPVCVPCEPCQSECSQCGGMPGSYFEGAVIEGDCQNCGPVTTYDPSYDDPGSEVVPQQGTASEGSGTRTDPGPTTPN